MTETEEREWKERLAAMVAEVHRKKAARAAFRAERQRARTYGKATYHAAKLRRNAMNNRDRCRYLTRHGNQCTGEPVDATIEAEALLCTRHLGYAIELLKAYRFTVTPSEAHNCADCADGVGIHPKGK